MHNIIIILILHKLCKLACLSWRRRVITGPQPIIFQKRHMIGRHVFFVLISSQSQSDSRPVAGSGWIWQQVGRHQSKVVYTWHRARLD